MSADGGKWLADPWVWRQGVPHERLARLRHHTPVSWHEHPDGLRGFWSVNRWTDAHTVLNDPATFSSRSGVVNLDDLDEELLDVRRTFLEEDPPRHGEIRSVIEDHFTTRAVRAFEGAITVLVDQVLDAALGASGPVDAVADLAQPVPIRALGRMLGVDEVRLDDLVRWGNELLAAPPTDLDDRDLASLPFGHPTALEVFRFADEMAEARRGRDFDDVTSALLHGEVEGAPLSAEEYRATWLMLVIAGNETTRHAITHGLLALADHPGALHRWRNQPDLEASAVEEIIRWSTPINWHRRQVTVDTMLGDVGLAAGDKLIVNFASANRDEERFDEPGWFDITRRPNHHMSFGRGGPHFCLGAHLARLELRVFFRRLLERADGIERAGEVRRLHSNHINGLAEAPVLLHLAG